MAKDRNEDTTPATRKSLHWELAKRDMTEDELAAIRDMNWEWYYNCYLFKDEPVEVTCKICGFMNVFLAGEKSKKCVHCGIECRRCEVDLEEK